MAFLLNLFVVSGNFILGILSTCLRKIFLPRLDLERKSLLFKAPRCLFRHILLQRRQRRFLTIDTLQHGNLISDDKKSYQNVDGMTSMTGNFVLLASLQGEKSGSAVFSNRNGRIVQKKTNVFYYMPIVKCCSHCLKTCDRVTEALQRTYFSGKGGGNLLPAMKKTVLSRRKIIEYGAHHFFDLVADFFRCCVDRDNIRSRAAPDEFLRPGILDVDEEDALIEL